jgi:hypothetical protein
MVFMTDKWGEAHSLFQIIRLGHLYSFHGNKGSMIQFALLESFLSQFKMCPGCLDILSKRKSVAEVISLLWSVNLYLLSQFCSFWADFCANYL